MSDSSRGAERGRHAPVYYALVALVLAAPLPFGAYPQWAWAGMAAVCGALLFCWSVSAFGGRMPVAAPPPFLWWAASSLGLVLIWGILQTADFMPESWRHPIWRDAAAALGERIPGSISLDPAAGRESVLRMAAYAAVFWLAFQYGRDSKRAGLALRAVAAGSACYALYGLAVVFSGAETILWFEKTDFADAATGTFVNPNHFGAYCGIGLLCATAVLSHRFSSGVRGKAGARERSRFLLVEFIPHNALLSTAWLALAGALPLSLSRGAAGSAALALLVLLAMLAARRGLSPRETVRKLVLALLAGLLLLILAGGALERRLWETAPDLAARSEIWSQTLAAIGESPLLGTGLGTFEAVYRSHRSEDVRPGALMAHNDYLELALELGIPAAGLLVFSVLVLAGGCARGVWLRRRDFEYPAAGVAVCVLAGAHSLVDFSLQIPAVAAAFSLVLGVAAAQSEPTGPLRRRGYRGMLASTLRRLRSGEHPPSVLR